MYRAIITFAPSFPQPRTAASSSFVGAAQNCRAAGFSCRQKAIWPITRVQRSSRVPSVTTYAMASTTSVSQSTERFANLFEDEGDAVVRRADGTKLSLIEFVQEQNEAGNAVLLGWLRHFGCTLCKKQVAEWRDWLPELNQNGKLTIAFVGNGPVSQLPEFRDEMEWPEFLFTDPKRVSYGALKFNKKLGNLINFSAVFAVIDSFKSQPQTWTRMATDPLQQGGVVLVNQEGFVTFFHADEYAGDHVSKDVLLDAVNSTTA